jgi:DNA-binding NtrC family response regulator
MVKVKVRIPQTDTPIEATLSEGKGLLIGRKPDVDKVARELPRGIHLSACSIPRPSVSENHAVLWSSGQSVVVQDLRSTNGTRVEMPAGERVTLGLDREVTLEVGPRSMAPLPKPRDADWSARSEFPLDVVAELTTWLAANSIHGSVRLRKATSSPSQRRCHEIPLSSGEVLEVVDETPNRTVDPRLEEAVKDIWEYVNRQEARVRERSLNPPSRHVVARSSALISAYEKVAMAAKSGLRVILLGETGSGKEELARYYHEQSVFSERNRRLGRFYAVNCAHFQGDFGRAQVAIFGAKKGTFTSLEEDREGALRIAERGTLFLDEVATLTIPVQQALLRVLDQGTYERLGDPSKELRADVRILCATSSDLRECLRQGTFLRDLWYRLNGSVIDVPPLRQRQEDIEEFMRTRRLSSPNSEEGPLIVDALTEEAKKHLTSYGWPGNFRELISFFQRLASQPKDPRERLIDWETCARVLREGAEDPSRSLAAASVAPSSASTPSSWQDLLTLASETFTSATGKAEPEHIKDVDACVNGYLKPIFVAVKTGLTQISELPKPPPRPYQTLARELNYGDGASVQEQLKTYIDIKKYMPRMP